MIFRIILASVLLHAAFSCMRLTVSLDALAHGASSLQVGAIVSLLALGPTFTAVACGRWIDRVGTRLPVFAGAAGIALAASIGLGLPASKFGLTPLYVVAFVAGLGFLCITLISQKMVGFLSEAATRQASFAWLAMGMSASGLLSPILSGYLIDGFSHQAVFAAALLLCASGVGVFLFSLSRLPSSLDPEKPKVMRHAWDLVLVPRLRNVLLVSALVSMAWDLQHFMFPVYGHAAGLSATEIGWLTGTFFSATFLVRFLMPWTSRHFTEWQFLTLTLVVGGIAYAAFPLFTSFPALVATAFVLGLGLGSSQPNVMSLLHSEAPEGRVGEALGIRTMATNACHAVLPSAFGVLTAMVGAASIFLAMACILACGAVAAGRIAAGRSRRSR